MRWHLFTWTWKVKENFDEWEQRGTGKRLLCVMTHVSFSFGRKNDDREEEEHQSSGKRKRMRTGKTEGRRRVS